MKIELTWGESIILRNAFVNQLSDRQLPVLNRNYLKKLNYSAFEGDPKLIELTREVIKRQIGREYKYVYLTNGATGGIEITLKAYRNLGFTECATYEAPYFRLYPRIIISSGLEHTEYTNENSVFLVDSPSNPQGWFRHPMSIGPLIWDTVYYTNSYARFLEPVAGVDVVIGSYSKMTGLNGIRIGWIATDDDTLAKELSSLVPAAYCGLSVLSMDLLKAVLPDFDWHFFETTARTGLDFNREEFSKLERYFSGDQVPSVGMFFYGRMDEACKKLFEKANVVWTPGSTLGHTDDYGRFNIGQSLDSVRTAVKQVLKADSTK